MKLRLALSSVLAAAFFACSAHAADFAFSFTGTSGSGISGSGVISTGESDPSGSYFTPSLLITGISGTFDGKNISGLLPSGTFYQTTGTFGNPGNDNILYYPSDQTYMGQSTYLDRQGVSFTAGKAEYNIYFGLGGYGEIKQGAGGAVTSDVGGTFTVTPEAISAAPEPGAWALMMLGIGAIGAMLGHRKRVFVEHKTNFVALT